MKLPNANLTIMPSFAAAPEGVAITSSAQGGSADETIERHEAVRS